MENSNSGTNTILIVILILVVVGFGFYWFNGRQPAQAPANNDGASLQINLDGNSDSNPSGSSAQ